MMPSIAKLAVFAAALGLSANGSSWAAGVPKETELNTKLNGERAQDLTSAVLAGEVTADLDGRPLAGARLLLESRALLRPVEAVTDVKGRFRVSLLPGGQYIVTYTHDGYIPRKTAMRLVAGQVGNASARLKAVGSIEEDVEIIDMLSLRPLPDKTDTIGQTVFSSDFMETVMGFGRSAAGPAWRETSKPPKPSVPPMGRQAADAPKAPSALPGPPIMGVSLKGASEGDILKVAEALKKTGLKDKGYDYIVLSDWQSSKRSIDNRLRFDAGLCGDGAALAKKLKGDFGIKVGLNTSISDLTDGGKPGSMNFEELDARAFADWGVGYVRVDYSHVTDVRKDKNGIGKGEWPTATPNLNYVGYNKLNGATALETRLPWAAFALEKGARISNNRLAGLSANGGAATFTINVAAGDAGEYMISFGYNKQRNGSADHERLIQAVVSNNAAGVHDEIYNYEFPRSSRWYNESRIAGIIGLKEGANVIALRNPVTGRETDARERYKALAASLARHSPGTLFAINDWGRAGSHAWADFAYSARAAADIRDWAGVAEAYNSAVASQNPAVYTDLGPINAFLSKEHVKAQLSICSILASPVLLDATAEKLIEHADLLGNGHFLSILNDALRLQGKRVSKRHGVDVVARPLSGDNVALLVFNKGASAASAKISLKGLKSRDSRIALTAAPYYDVTDAWSGRTESKDARAFMTPMIPVGGAALLIVKSPAK